MCPLSVEVEDGGNHQDKGQWKGGGKLKMETYKTIWLSAMLMWCLGCGTPSDDSLGPEVLTTPQMVVEQFGRYLEEGKYISAYGLLSEKSKEEKSPEEFVKTYEEFFSKFTLERFEVIQTTEEKDEKVIVKVRYTVHCVTHGSETHTIDYPCVKENGDWRILLVQEDQKAGGEKGRTESMDRT